MTRTTAELAGFGRSMMATLIAVTVKLLIAIIPSHVLAWKIAMVCIPTCFGTGVLQIMELAHYQWRRKAEAVNSIMAISALSAWRGRRGRTRYWSSHTGSRLFGGST